MPHFTNKSISFSQKSTKKGVIFKKNELFCLQDVISDDGKDCNHTKGYRYVACPSDSSKVTKIMAVHQNDFARVMPKSEI